MTSLLPLILVTFILQACVAAPENSSENRSERLSKLKDDELVVAINKFLKSLDLEQIVRELFSMNQGQLLIKLNQIRNGLNINGDDLNMMMNKIASALENYSIKDVENLDEAQIVSIAQRVLSQIQSYQDMINGKIFAIADELNIEKSKIFEVVSNLTDVFNRLSEPKEMEEVIHRNIDQILAISNGVVDLVEMYNLEPVFKAMLNAMKEAPSKERS